MRKGPQFVFVIHDHCQIFDIFFNSTFLIVQSQQGVKNIVRFGGLLRGGVARDSGEESSFG